MSVSPSITKSLLLDEAIRQFVPSAKFAGLLESHHDRVLALKARGASHAQIHDLLKSHGIVASEPAIGRFCRKYRDEVKRVQLLLERDGEPPVPSASVPFAAGLQTPVTPSSPGNLNSITPRPRKIRDLRGDV